MVGMMPWVWKPGSLCVCALAQRPVGLPRGLLLSQLSEPPLFVFRGATHPSSGHVSVHSAPRFTRAQHGGVHAQAHYRNCTSLMSPLTVRSRTAPHVTVRIVLGCLMELRASSSTRYLPLSPSMGLKATLPKHQSLLTRARLCHECCSTNRVDRTTHSHMFLSRCGTRCAAWAERSACCTCSRQDDAGAV